MEKWSRGYQEVIRRLWEGGLDAVERWSGGCGEVV